jgi:membrane associated rhomboid family serine protease
VEKIFGTRLYAVTYLASVLGGGVCAAAMHPGVTSVGASGGLFGVMGAIWVFGGIRFFAMKKHVSIIDRRRVYRWVKGYGALLLGNIYFTMKFAKIANISVGGHLGGLLAGAVFGLVALMVVPPRREF